MVSEQPCNPWLIMCSVHLVGEKTLKLQSNEDDVFLSRGEFYTLDLALKKIDRLLISTVMSYFHGSPFTKNYTIKRAWWGVILGKVTFWEFILGAHEWSQSALKRLVLVWWRQSTVSMSSHRWSEEPWCYIHVLSSPSRYG